MYATRTELRVDEYQPHARDTIENFDRLGIAVFPAKPRTKGSYVAGWPTMSVADAAAVARADLSRGPVNLAGRTGDGVAVFDLDAKDGVVPTEMLVLLRRLVGPAVIAIVRTSRGFHIWVKVAESVANGYCSFIGGEIFSAAHLAMLPPSVHPSGDRYAWEVEPREPDAAVDLRSMGLVPDKPAPSSRSGGSCTREPAAPEIQDEFARLMAEAGVTRGAGAPQQLTLCPWHDDRSPSLSINWAAAVFYCFSARCQSRGGIGSLRRRLHPDTPSYRQGATAAGPSPANRGGDHPSGDKSGCTDVDAETERLARALDEVGLDEKARSVRDCRAFFRVGKCTSCARTPAFPISCGLPLCVRCMPGRLAADWGRHRASFPEKVTVLMLRPKVAVDASPGALRKVRSRFPDWRRRTNVTGGVYGVRLDPQYGAVIMLAIPSDAPIPESSRAFDVEVVALEQTPSEFMQWLQAQYVKEAQSWATADDLTFLINETKSRRRFQGFGGVYGEPAEPDSKEESQMSRDSKASTEPAPLRRISGGSFKGKHAKGDPGCPFCGGLVEMYPFTVPAAEVDKVGNRWLWRGASSGPPEGRRQAR